jgi:hypothetical protein
MGDGVMICASRIHVRYSQYSLARCSYWPTWTRRPDEHVRHRQWEQGRRPFCVPVWGR